jgi:nicotinate-nucleotide adenylyltransferase
MHVLVYGGTFDPIHNGHLITSRAARELLGADLVLLIPAWVSPLKKGEPPSATPRQRLEMIRLAIKDDSDFAADDCEIVRGTQGQPSYTIDTLEALRERRPSDRFTLLLGQDQLAKFHVWHRVDDILAQFDIALMGRPGNSPNTALSAVNTTLGAAVAAKLESCFLPTPLIEISATTIRSRLRARLPISHMLPHPVAAYIAARDMYSAP